MKKLLISISEKKKIKSFSRALLAFSFLMLTLSTAAHAQGIVAGANRISQTIIQLINIAFPVACGLALIAVIWFVFTKNPQWKDYTIGLFIGLLLWGAYTTYKDEIFSYFGGTDQFSVQGINGGN
ncbi:hypothetical protein OKW21_006629 [Catalinimonas alkaloidigena]|uniref:hypothetical protein n=1 Tax=Catalinimonas alkaloidigena TaxID=1075417 RepID=UPI002405839C|nr:hypothetical protein [Catalinimonas alkaloidigena]MDF9801320.1 hypothetical protein [Catalinimonas alkaloidigena]